MTGYEVRDTAEAIKENESDPTAVPPLQVGAILSIMKPEENDKNTWNLDPELLSFLGQAAAAYEERIEIQHYSFLFIQSLLDIGNDIVDGLNPNR